MSQGAVCGVIAPVAAIHDAGVVGWRKPHRQYSADARGARDEDEYQPLSLLELRTGAIDAKNVTPVSATVTDCVIEGAMNTVDSCSSLQSPQGVVVWHDGRSSTLLVLQPRLREEPL